jgi:hypothetical protein
MSTARDVAEWMAGHLYRDGKLYEKLVIFPLKEKFGNEFVSRVKAHWAIRKDVLAEFKKLAPTEKVVWVEKGRYWRLRVPEDVPGKRLQRNRTVE